MIKLSVLKKKKEYLTCKEIEKMVIPYIKAQLCDHDLRNFVAHVRECHECREELETYYIVYKGLMQLDEKAALPMNIIEALDSDLEHSGQHLRHMSLFHIVSEIVRWLVNISCSLFMLKKILELILGV